MPSYKLKYFNAQGRAETCRLLFALKEVPYTDERFEMGQWPTEKEKTPFGWVPVLTIDDKVQLCDSTGIARYLAREFGLYGGTNLEGALIDQVIGVLLDAQQQLMKFTFVKDAAKKEELKKEAYTNGLPKYLTALNKMLEKKKFYVGDKATLADIAAFDLLGHLDKPFVSQYKNVAANMEAVGNIPQIKKHVSQRKPTPF